MSNIDLRLGNVLDVLAQMPSESVHCIVTSPPYWGLRAYGTEPQVWRNGSEPCPDGHTWGETQVDIKETWGHGPTAHIGTSYSPRAEGHHVKEHREHNTCTRCGAWRGELGLEPQPEMFVDHIVAVMREARRVLRADGTLWLNIGDSFASGSACARRNVMGNGSPTPDTDRPNRLVSGLKEKDLVGIPWMVAFALRADGWYLRMDCIWHKPNPMPESVRDRPTKAHEYLFLLSKSPKYFYDADAVRENEGQVYTRKANKDGNAIMRTERGRETRVRNIGGIGDKDTTVNGRNHRSVWSVTTSPFGMEMCEQCDTVYTSTEYRHLAVIVDDEDKEHRVCRVCGKDNKWMSHFATFPPKLIEPCILAATSERGVCSKCGAPWVREVKASGGTIGKGSWVNHDLDAEQGGSQRTGSRSDGTYKRVTIGWRASCACDAGEPVPATVLDLFNGAGTTGLVALQHGRNYIGIDLKDEYLQITRARLDKAQIQMVTV